MLPLKASSAWSAEETGVFLANKNIPLRLSTMSRQGYPLVCSLWFVFAEECFWCASHKNSQVIANLRTNSRCGFEVAADQPPYCGVRGQGDVRLVQEDAESILSKLIQRYLGGESSSLADWLMSRSEDEYIIQIKPKWLNTWDYSERMSG